MQTPLAAISEFAFTRATYNRLYLWSACLVAALGGLIFGHEWLVITGPDICYEKYFNLVAAADIGWAKGCVLVGCLPGAMLSGMLSDRFGRKPLLIPSGSALPF